MKRLLALILVLCTCTAVLFSFASCGDGENEEKTEAPTAAPLPDGVADASLIVEIKEGMTREQIRELLGVEPTKYDGVYDQADVYIFSDGRAAYIEYTEDEAMRAMTVEETVDPVQIDEIKIGDSYRDITDIFGGVKGTNTVSVPFGLYRYVLDDGRLLYVYYNDRRFASTISIEGENGEVNYPYPPSKEYFICDDMDEFKELLAGKFEGEATSVIIPKLVSGEYKVEYARCTASGYFFSFIPNGCYPWSEDYADQRFYIEIYESGLTYKELIDFYEAGHAKEVVKYGDTAAYVGTAFVFNNNGIALIVNIPKSLCELYERDENSPPPVTNLEELNKYIVIEYLDLSETEAQE